MATPQKAGSQMSSRLLTMKFMQRAAASSTPNTPTKQQSSTSDAAQPPTKRRKTDSNPPHLGNANAADLAAVHAALAAEEEKRQRALDRQAAEAGDTKWQIRVEPNTGFLQSDSLEVVSAGYGFIDEHADAAGDGEVKEEDEGDRKSSVRMGRVAGRRSFGNFGKAVESIHDREQSGTSDSDSDSNTSNSSSSSTSSRRSKPRTNPKVNTTQAGSRLRDSLTSKRKREKADAAQLADKRRSKEVKLNKLSSISSGGGSYSSRPSLSGVDNRTCYKCGGKGHTQRDCPGGGRGKGRSSM